MPPAWGQAPPPGPVGGYGYMAPPPAYGSGYPVTVPFHVWDSAAPYGRDVITGRPLSDKSKVAAGLLQIFLGTLGVGRFYTGHVGIALGQLIGTVVGWLTAWLFIGLVAVLGVAIWALVDGIVILSTASTDSRGLLLRP